MVEIAEDENGMVVKRMGVFNDVVHGFDVFEAGGGIGIGGGESVEVYKGYGLSL